MYKFDKGVNSDQHFRNQFVSFIVHNKLCGKNLSQVFNSSKR